MKTAVSRVYCVVGCSSRWQVAADVHGVVQNSYDLDPPGLSRVVQHEVAPSSPLPRNMQGAHTRPNLVPRSAVGEVRAVGQCRECRDQCAPVNEGLPSPELLSCPLKVGDKVAFSCFR
jgi:hypothetical protein